MMHSYSKAGRESKYRESKYEGMIIPTRNTDRHWKGSTAFGEDMPEQRGLNAELRKVLSLVGKD